MFKVTLTFHVHEDGDSRATDVQPLAEAWLFDHCGSTHEVFDPNTGVKMGEIELADFDPETDGAKVEAV